MHRLIHLRLKHLRLLEQLIEHGTLRKAAKSVHVSEPAASQMLRDMESTFGVTLFERGRRGMAPNAASSLVVNRARVILRELQAMEDDIADLSSQRNETIQLGALPRCMYALIPATLARLYEHGFEPRIQILEASSPQLLDGLDRGELDLALTRVIDDRTDLLSGSAFQIIKLFEERSVIVCSSKHPLATRHSLNLTDLLEYHWVLPGTNSLTRKLFDSEFINMGLVPPVPKVEGRTATSLSLVQHSAFLSICPASLANDWARKGLLHVLPIELQVPLPPICAIWRASKSDNPSILTIRDALLESSGQPAAGECNGTGKRTPQHIEPVASEAKSDANECAQTLIVIAIPFGRVRIGTLNEDDHA